MSGVQPGSVMAHKRDTPAPSDGLCLSIVKTGDGNLPFTDRESKC